MSLAEEELLDALDPLRHLRQDYQDSDTSSPLPQQRFMANEEIELNFANDVRVKLHVDAGPGCGGIPWPAGEVLSNYVARRGNFMQGMTVLELGSGTGLVGLVAATLGARVYLTDQLPLLKLMQKNIHLNDLSGEATALELNWGMAIPQDIPQKLDLILAADCVYFEPAFPLLVETLSNLVKEGRTEVLFCYKKRRKADKRFFNLLKTEFEWLEVADDPDRATYSREGISLLRLRRKSK